jgi:hypothetical protein
LASQGLTCYGSLRSSCALYFIHPFDINVSFFTDVVRKVLEREGSRWKLSSAVKDWYRRGLPVIEGSNKLLRTQYEADNTMGFFVARFKRIRTDKKEAQVDTGDASLDTKNSTLIDPANTTHTTKETNSPASNIDTINTNNTTTQNNTHNNTTTDNTQNTTNSTLQNAANTLKSNTETQTKTSTEPSPKTPDSPPSEPSLKNSVPSTPAPSTPAPSTSEPSTSEPDLTDISPNSPYMEIHSPDVEYFSDESPTDFPNQPKTDTEPRNSETELEDHRTTKRHKKD